MNNLVQPPAARPVAPLRFAAALLVLGCAWPALGGETRSGATHLLYEARWGGLHVADLSISLETGDGKYANRLELETRGLTRMVSGFSATAESEGTIAGAGRAGNLMPGYRPRHYRTDYSNRKHLRWIEINFTGEAGQENEPASATTGTSPHPDGSGSWNPAEKGPEELDNVEKDMLVGVMDPLSMISQLLTGVRAHLAGGPDHFSIKGFDGKRRFDFAARYLGPVSRTANDRTADTYHVRVSPLPLAGFKKRHREIWENADFDFYLLRDESMAPFQIMPLKHGPVINLVKSCRAPCQLPAGE